MKSPSAPLIKAPLPRGSTRVIKEGNIRLKLHHWFYHGPGGRVYRKFQVRWRGERRMTSPGKFTRRECREFPNEKAALEFAREKAKALDDGRREAGSLHPQEVQNFKSCVVLLAQPGLRSDEAARMAADNYECAREALGREPSVLEQIAFHREAMERQRTHHRSRLQRMDISAAVEAYLADKLRLDLIQDRHERDLRSRLGWLIREFPGVLSDLDVAAVWQRIVALKLSNKTVVHYRAAIRGFLGWAQEKALISKDTWSTAQAWRKPKVALRVQTIWTVAELKRILRQANASDRDRRLIPYLVIGAFAAVRSAELCGLEWQMVSVEKGLIRISSELAKGRRADDNARIVEMPAGLRRWLARFGPHRAGLGERVAPYADMHQFLRRLAREAGLKWVHNILRRSAISHAKAMGVSLEDVARQAGNSATMAKAHYVNTDVDREGAAEWFNLGPEVCDLAQPELRLVTGTVANPSRTRQATA